VAPLLVALSAARPSLAAVQGLAGSIPIRLADAPPQPPPDNEPGPAGTARIRGRILAADTGEPLRRADVHLNGPELHETRSTITDVNGEYEFSDLPPGRYWVDASDNGFIGLTYGQTKHGASRKSILIKDKEGADQIDIRLPRGGVIAGRVLDEFGSPVAGAAVTAMRPQFRQGRRGLMLTAGHATTNDIGEYRLSGLAPGDYAIAATAPLLSTVPGPRSNATKPPGFATTYHPSTPDVRIAARLTIAFGQTLHDVDVMLIPARLAEISGAAFDSEGQAIGPGSVHATLRGDQIGLPGTYYGILNADGSFRIPNMPPGEYVVTALSRFAPPPSGTEPRAQAIIAASVTVNGEDMTGVALAPINPVTVTGRIVFDNPSAARSLKASAIQVLPILVKPDESGPLFTPIADIGNDFRFELKASPGLTALRATATTEDGRWMLKAVRVHGLDITDTGIELKQNEHVDEVEIEFTNRLQRVAGLVTDAAGQPPSTFFVLVFAQERSGRSVKGNRFWAFTNVANDSRYEISSLPPGDYLAVALELEQPPAGWQDPDWLDSISRDAVRFSLSEGETRRLDLRLITPHP
jgi:protocatechuate 3,4-dioxygenase beta subunit